MCEQIDGQGVSPYFEQVVEYSSSHELAGIMTARVPRQANVPCFNI